jgi:hypothetical protein
LGFISDLILPALRSTQPLTKMTTGDVLWGVKLIAARAEDLNNLHDVPIVYKHWEPLISCNRLALPIDITCDVT